MCGGPHHPIRMTTSRDGRTTFAPPVSTAPETSPDPAALLRSPAYVKLLVLAAIIGVPISALAYGFLKLVAELQHLFFESLPEDLGLDPVPSWWVLPVLILAGLLVAPAISRLPGRGGHSPADGFQASGPVPPRELPSIFLAALGTLSFGVVLGPEAPLIMMGSGLGVLAVHLAARDAPQATASVIAAAGSFAAISALLGSPLLGAFLLLEAAGLGGAMVGLILMPGLLAAGIGAVVFLGLDSVTGFGTLSLAIPGLPAFDHLTVAIFAYALLFGLAAPPAGRAIKMLAVAARAPVERHMTMLMPVVGAVIAALAIVFAEATGESTSMVLFSGQDQMGPLLSEGTGWSVGVLVLLIACKGLAYAASLSCFRGGPVFPSMFIGAAGGIAASGLPGLPLVPAVAMGIGAMCCTMLNLPLTATLLATVLLGSDGVQCMPVVIVAVVVAYVTTARLTPAPPVSASPDSGDAAPGRAPDAHPIRLGEP
jgi:chloride channel protein, CIC family